MTKRVSCGCGTFCTSRRGITCRIAVSMSSYIQLSTNITTVIVVSESVIACLNSFSATIVANMIIISGAIRMHTYYFSASIIAHVVAIGILMFSHIILTTFTITDMVFVFIDMLENSSCSCSAFKTSRYSSASSIGVMTTTYI